jgi:hypothetical protein
MLMVVWTNRQIWSFDQKMKMYVPRIPFLMVRTTERNLCAKLMMRRLTRTVAL